MGFDVRLSNPYITKLIAKSKKKKVDVRIMADLPDSHIVESHALHKRAKLQKAE